MESYDARQHAAVLSGVGTVYLKHESRKQFVELRQLEKERTARGLPATGHGWTFLTGTKRDIDALVAQQEPADQPCPPKQ